MIRSGFFRELKRYTIADVAEILHVPSAEVLPLLRDLKKREIIKSVRGTLGQRKKLTLDDGDIDTLDADFGRHDQLFVFDYVGVIVTGRCVLKCYPKYISHDTSPVKRLQQVLRVIEKYDADQQPDKMASNSNGDLPFDLLAVIVYLIRDFEENGAYWNQERVLEMNGDGEVNWERTINETLTLLRTGRPYYVDLYTHTTASDYEDYFRRLHLCIIADCCAVMRETGLDELFSLRCDYSYDGSLDDFGSSEYVLYRLEQELGRQFMTRKQLLLETMHVYVAERGMLGHDLGLSLYGTSSFNLVWERVCSAVLGDSLHSQLGQLKVPLTGSYQTRGNAPLAALIEKPVWRALLADGTPGPPLTRDTLVPDIVCIYRKEGALCFGVFDAKYYSIRLDEQGVSGCPGVEDIAKQHMYQLAFNDFIKAHNFAHVENAFLFPSEDTKIAVWGTAKLPILGGLGTEPALKDIDVVGLPTASMYQWYLEGRQVDIGSELRTT
jgi:DNA-binding Lrp family transcriptional regulator